MNPRAGLATAQETDMELIQKVFFSWHPEYRGLPYVEVSGKVKWETHDDQLRYRTEPGARSQLDAKWRFLGGEEWHRIPWESLWYRRLMYLQSCDLVHKVLSPEEYFNLVEDSHRAEQFRHAAKRKHLNIDTYWYDPMRKYPMRSAMVGLGATVVLTSLSYMLSPGAGLVVAVGLIYMQLIMWAVVRSSRRLDPYQLDPGVLDSDPLGMPQVYARWRLEQNRPAELVHQAKRWQET